MLFVYVLQTYSWQKTIDRSMDRLRFDGRETLVIFGPAVTLHWLLYTKVPPVVLAPDFDGDTPTEIEWGWMEEWENPAWI